MENYISEVMELPKKIRLPKDTEVTNDLIKKLLKIQEKEVERYKTLQGYYEGKAKILDREKDKTKSNNKIVFNYPSYIVDMLLGLFVGKPVTYTSDETMKEKLKEIQKIFDYNDEQDENTELAKLMGIMGKAYEIVYLDEDGVVRFNKVSPQNIVFVYDDELIHNPLMALYVRDMANLENLTAGTPKKAITVYTAESIKEYEQDGSDFKLIEENINVFRDVNVIEYLNNDDCIGDFERVLTLIDEMNLLNSDTANDFEEFTNAILVLYGMLNTNSDDVRQLIKDRVLLLDKLEGGSQDARWLTKDINDSALQNYKITLNEMIHKFAKVPDMSDEKFAGNVSGERLRHAC